VAKKEKQTKIPRAIDAEVMYKSDRKCCVCKKKGKHIHHLGDKNNHNFDNLALLCFKCHDDATITRSLSKKLSKETIVKYREQHYQVIKNVRQQELETFNHPIKELSEETLLTACKNAVIIIELEKIKEEYLSANWDKRGKILGQIFKFSNHSNHRLAFDIFDFLEFAASQTRGGMPRDVASSLFSAVLEFCPSFYNDENPEQTDKIAKMCIQMGDHIAYDSTIYLRNLEITMWGLSILKFIYRSAKRNDKKELMNEVVKTYDELESTLRRPERNDLGNAQELVKIFRNHLDEWNLSFPPLPKYLMVEVYKNRK